MIVCGGGPAGFAAAVAAAERGASTLLIERYGFLGGTGTAAMMVEFGSIHDGAAVTVGGLTHRFLHRMVDHGGAIMRDPDSHRVVYDPESMISVCQDMTEASGARMLLHAQVAGAVREGDRVTGVIVESKSGRQAYLGRAVVDATGDGDVAARAGARFHLGREGDGKMQPVTLVVLVGNVDATRCDGPALKKALNESIPAAKKAGEWPIPTDCFFSCSRVLKRGEPDDPTRAFFFMNVTNALGVDGTRAEDLTRAELETRRQVGPLVRFLRKRAPGFENCYLDRTAAQVGIRETRRVVGDYTLTGKEVLAATHFEDGIAPSHQTIDVHDVDGRAFEHGCLKRGTHYEIPYRCLLPAGLEGLLLAGRCISVDHHALGSIRRMVTCMPVGEACGVAAAMAAARGGSPRGIPVASLREELRRGGTLLG